MEDGDLQTLREVVREKKRKCDLEETQDVRQIKRETETETLRERNTGKKVEKVGAGGCAENDRGEKEIEREKGRVRDRQKDTAEVKERQSEVESERYITTSR